MAFPGVLVKTETEITSSRIWTQVSDSFFHDLNHNAKWADATLPVVVIFKTSLLKLIARQSAPFLFTKLE